jgi:Tfp pilus assembly protein PilF
MRVLASLGATALLMLTACVSGPDPKDIKAAEIQYDLGVNDLRNARPLDALRNFQEAVRLNPNMFQAQNGLGLAYYVIGDYEKALVHLQKALELKPDYSEVMNSIGRVHMAQNRFREAIPWFRKALENVFLPERYLAESNLGWALFQVGETEEAFRLVKGALAQNEKYCVGYEYLGLMYQEQKKLEDAVEHLRRMVELCPEYVEGRLHLARALLLAGIPIEGCRQLTMCMEKNRMSLTGQECERLHKLTCRDAAAAPAAPPPAR